MDKIFKFHKSKFFWWHGRYGRLIGGSYWKVALNNEILVVWHVDNDTKLILQAKKSPEIEKLAQAVNEAKQIMGSYGGGVFSINEFGQVIVPSADGDGRRIYVGEIEGKILLKNPYEDSRSSRWIDISDDSNFKLGDLWPYPYLGIVYRLSNNNRIYYVEESEDERRAVFPVTQDEVLVKKIRTIRKYGFVRFIVNPYGIVLTKKPTISGSDYTEEWQSIYVGRIDYNKWFEKEEI